MTLTLMQGHSGSVEEQIQLLIILTTKQTIKIKLAVMVGHNKYYFSLKSSVPVILNYGHTSVSCKILWSCTEFGHQCLLSEQDFGV